MLAGKETHDNYVTNVASRICVDDFWDSSSSMQHCAAETAQTGGFLQKQVRYCDTHVRASSKSGHCFAPPQL
jgi:hypothetical protein